MMVKISYAPVNELVVHEVVHVEYEDLLRERVTPAGNLPLYWCKGLLFSFSSVPMNKDVMRDYLKGTIHWMEVHFTEMKAYQQVLELNDEGFKAMMKIRVIDTSKSALHADFAAWLKGNKK